jgi:hypothetical protein
MPLCGGGLAHYDHHYVLASTDFFKPAINVSTTMPHLLVEPLPIPLPEAVASETSEPKPKLAKKWPVCPCRELAAHFIWVWLRQIGDWEENTVNRFL